MILQVITTISCFAIISAYNITIPPDEYDNITWDPFLFFPENIRTVNLSQQDLDAITDGFDDLPLYTACGNLTYFNHGVMRREEDIIHATEIHSASVVFLHGLGSTGAKAKEIVLSLVPNFTFPHIKFIFPTAPLIPYTPAGGEMKRAWFDKTETYANSPEREETLKKAIKDLKEVVSIERDIGIPPQRVIIGGFSQGGAMALHMGYTALPQLAGVFALSAYLHENSTLFKDLEKKKLRKKLPTLFYAHGDKDKVVLHKWGKATFDRLIRHGIDGEFQTEAKLPHRVRKEELEALYLWLYKKLPYDRTTDYFGEDYYVEYPSKAPTTLPWTEY